MAQRYKFSVESKSFPLDISGEPELALIIIGVFVLILGIILGYAMIHEYRIYLDDHYKARYSFRDFIKRERFYIYLFFASIFIFLTNLFIIWSEFRIEWMN